MSAPDLEFIKQAMRLKRQLENDLRFEFLKYLENLKTEGQAAQTTSILSRQIRAAIQTLPGLSAAKTLFDPPKN